MRILFFLVISCLWLTSCDSSTNFYKLEKLRTEITIIEHNTKQIYEYVVISNPPSNADSLAYLINCYNDSSLNFTYLNDTTISYYQRFFYAETNDINRNYIENQSFFKEDFIGYHVDDIIASVKKKSNKWFFIIKINDNYEGWNPEEWKLYPLHIAGQPSIPTENIIW